jgi:hypothetical protein
VEHDAFALHVGAALGDDLGEALIKGVGKADVADDAALEEGEGADALGAVDGLVGDDKIHGLDGLLQGTDGGEGDDGADANVTQGGNVGAVGDLVRRKLVVDTVAGQEGDVDVVVAEDADGRGRGTPGSIDGELGDGLVAVELGEAGAADDGDVHRLVKGRGKGSHCDDRGGSRDAKTN